LADDILPDHRYNEHNAGDDVRMLYDLLSVAGVTEEQLQEHSFLVTNVEDRKKFSSQQKTLIVIALQESRLHVLLFSFYLSHAICCFAYAHLKYC
jgi:predicted HAD superfamily phosphohydrolase